MIVVNIYPYDHGELWVNVSVAIFSVPVEEYGVLLCYGGKFSQLELRFRVDSSW